MKGRALLVDDDRAMCEMLEGALARRGFEVVSRTSAEEAVALLGTNEYDVVVTDLNMQGTSGLELCQRIVANRPDLPVVVVTAFGSLETAVGAIRAGAYDFVTKPFEMEDLALTLERAIAHKQLREEVKRLRFAVRESQQHPSEMVGASAPMQKVYDLVSRVAETEASVLITGESGTGKELVAKAIHARSRRAQGPFVAINCAAMPESLLESELFGHTKGAFTDARQSRAGLFLQASGGTLMLDEIGEMPVGMQAKLLRVLQERTVRPVGGDRETPFDTRILAATNRDLDTEVAERRFREDLFYRINVVRIHVPPLRARGSDVLALAQSFIERFAAVHRTNVKGLSSPAAERLLAYSWPGNVRELQNCIERAVALARFEMLGVDDLPDKLRDYRPTRVIVESEDPAELLPMAEVERRYVLRVLQAVGGNKTLAADVLGFDRRTLYRKLERYGALENSGTVPATSSDIPASNERLQSGTSAVAPASDDRDNKRSALR
ncbi:MAG TPA: sigma-54 dependent transcriptional regulator [Polyangiaceae bacterium]|jgi:two-component system response regulator HydG